MKWAKSEHKRAKRQAGFRCKHSTINHGTTLRFFVENIWNTQGVEAFCCFVDFKKASNTVPQEKLWLRMKELQIPIELRAATQII